jgi:hypothetical protein
MFRFGSIHTILTALGLGILLTASAFAETNEPFLEKNVDRWGSDYSIFEIKDDGVNACYQACAKDKQCLAWTWHRPGTRGKFGECHLKSKVAKARPNPCCISGVLVGQGVAADDRSRSGIGTGRLSRTRLDGPVRLAVTQRPSNSFFRKAKMSSGEAIGLPELTIAALTPPLRITPISFARSDDL